MELEEFSRIADDIIDELPAVLCNHLNGGFVVLPQRKKRGRYLIMGEYIVGGGMGRYIAIYFGSFLALLGGRPSEIWEQELKETIIHELRHHVESLAGIDDLVVEETLELMRFEKEHPRA